MPAATLQRKYTEGATSAHKVRTIRWIPAGSTLGPAFCLLAVAGWKSMETLPYRRQVLAVSLAVTLVLEFPYRCFEAFTVTEPFAAADHYLRSFKEPFVVVDTIPIWYGQDLVRNDPFLTNTPKFFFRWLLKPEQAETLMGRGKLRIVTASELLQLGLTERRKERRP